MKRLLILSLFLTGMYTSCKKGGTPAALPADPEKAQLLAPLNNEACAEGELVSETQSKVVLKWQAAEHADSYKVVIKNLLNNNTATYTSTSTSLELSLERNTPFSWHVVSGSEQVNTTVKSDTWKFYNAGAGIRSYAPFPADNMSPAMSAEIPAGTGKVELGWSSSDADQDISNFDIYFGTTPNPGLLSSNVSANSMNNITVAANKVYYWKIITRDSKGNTSDSGVYYFHVN